MTKELLAEKLWNKHCDKMTPECRSKICVTNDIHGNYAVWEWGKYEK